MKTGEVPLTRGEALGYASEALGYAEETRQRLKSKGKQILGKLGPASELLSGAGGQLAATASWRRRCCHAIASCSYVAVLSRWW